MTRARASATAAAAGAASLAWWSIWHEPRNGRLRHLTIRPPGWPSALHGLSVAVLADLHLGSPHMTRRRAEGIVARVNREEPDLVFLLGDYADQAATIGERIVPTQVAAVLGRLEARLGCYAVLGNHDWSVFGGSMAVALKARGITVLENDATRVDAAPAPLWVAGLADVISRVARLDEALGVVPAGGTVLLLTHNPDVFPHVPDRVALTLAGHTHGAQVDIPLLRDVTTPSRHGSRYTKGHQVEKGRHLFVSPGIGTSRLPIRFRARPEVTLLRLESTA